MHIEAVAITRGGERRPLDHAARRCLERAHCRADELDLLVNVGIYKERNIAEPAFAALVQEDIGANPGRDLHRPSHGHGTFSFDLANSGCGVLSALEVCGGFLDGGLARSALIVASDVEPKRGESRGFPYASSGGALLVRAGGPGRFGRFLFRSFPELASLGGGRIEWDPATERNLVVVEEQAPYAARCRELAAVVARELLAREGLAIRDVDLLVASQYPRRFSFDLARLLELPSSAMSPLPTDGAAAHTAGPIAALDAVIASGQLAAARNVLFVTVGAGITVGAVLYDATAR